MPPPRCCRTRGPTAQKVKGPAGNGTEHSHVATILTSLGQVILALGNPATARVACEWALRIDEEVLGPDHPNMARDRNNLAGALQALGDLAEARVACERALSIDEEALGPEHPEVANDLNNLSYILWRQGDMAGAQAVCKRAPAIVERALGPEHPQSCYIRGNLMALNSHRKKENDIMASDTFNLSGDLRGANMFVKSTLTNVSVGVRNMVGVEDAEKDELQALAARLNDALQQVPPEKQEDAEAVAKRAEQLVAAAQQENPNRPIPRIAADGLKRAAQTLAMAASPALGIAMRIVDLIAKMRGL